MKKILLIGHAGFFNRGCEAIVRGSIEIIRHYIPECIITLCSNSVEDTTIAREKNIKVDKIIPAMRGAKKPSLSWLWQTFDRRILSFNMPFHDYLQYKYYKENDIVISIGGDNFTDDYGQPSKYFNSLVYAKKAGAKTAIWAASIGPFKDKIAEKKWADIMRRVDLITVREDVTVKYLESLGITQNVQSVADPAFLMQCKKPDDSSLDLSKSNLKVGIGLSDLISRYGIKSENYIKSFADFIEYVCKSSGAQIILVPHVTCKAEGANDWAVCNKVRALLPASCPSVVLSKNYDACEMKYFISQCDFFIGARTHSTIASFSMEIPTITIAYSNKAWGINRQILDTDEFVIPIKEVSYDMLVEKFAKLQEKASEIKRKLHDKLPSVRKNAMKSGESLANVLGL